MKTLPILFALSSAALFAAPFQNGGFELPGTSSTVFLGAGDTFVTGWIHGGVNFVEYYSQAGQFGINPGEGTYFVGFGNNAGTNGTMSQIFDTSIGTTYNINYLLAVNGQAGPNPAQVALVQALDGSTILNSVTNSLTGSNGIYTNGLTLSFTATSSSTTLRFTDQTTLPNSASANWVLDGITVGAVAPSQVPEPATYVLMGLGLGVLSICRKRFCLGE